MRKTKTNQVHSRIDFYMSEVEPASAISYTAVYNLGTISEKIFMLSLPHKAQHVPVSYMH